eukprot:tig00000378_g24509.t1
MLGFTGPALPSAARADGPASARPSAAQGALCGVAASAALRGNEAPALTRGARRFCCSYLGGTARFSLVRRLSASGPLNLPPKRHGFAVEARKTEVDEHLLVDMGQRNTLLVVDGYNTIGAWEHLRKLAVEGEMAQARQLLIDWLIDFASARSWKVEVVFDAQYAQGFVSVSKEGGGEGVHVVYTEEGQTADSFIEAQAHQLLRLYKNTDFKLIVATSDYAQQRVVGGSGALVISQETLRVELERTRAEVRETIQRLRKANSNAGLTRLGDMVGAETRRRLEDLRFSSRRGPRRRPARHRWRAERAGAGPGRPGRITAAVARRVDEFRRALQYGPSKPERDRDRDRRPRSQRPQRGARGARGAHTPPPPPPAAAAAEEEEEEEEEDLGEVEWDVPLDEDLEDLEVLEGPPRPAPGRRRRPADLPTLPGKTFGSLKRSGPGPGGKRGPGRRR